MTDVTIPQLVPAIALGGAEQLEIVQNGVSKSATVSLFIPFYPPAVPGLPGTATRLQFFSAVAILADMNLLFQALPPDWNNASTIDFYAGNVLQITGSLALLAKTTFGWTNNQLSNCFILAATLPQ